MTPITLHDAPPIHIGRMPIRRDVDVVLWRRGLASLGLQGELREYYRIVADLQFWTS